MRRRRSAGACFARRAACRSDAGSEEARRAIASRAPIAAETAKQNFRAAWEMSIADAIAYERDLQTICFATEDAQEGRAAFKEKRSPDFRHR